MSVTYGIIKEELSLNGDSRIAYGIVAYEDSDEVGTATITKTIPDITSDKEELEQFVQKCNRLKLSIINLDEAVDDFLGE